MMFKPYRVVEHGRVTKYTSSEWEAELILGDNPGHVEEYTEEGEYERVEKE